ncbi:ATP-binding protein [Candidatus Viridilinea mediisalina]|uniref:Orc1-like AAA ATPase domain-containing protein n=1 Tax=Candidatus Viridilinea mediisalina TaxID=2024553 RepID=A0A2A6RGP6_9CHLR|nr:ATP-binding protein [Candidatus Viridilinea mediisalina]PDW02237.1 hypothetical protein CJ255_15090 [Candidatus Viridilinea mediisalina]
MEARAPFVGRTAEIEHVLQHINGLCYGATPQLCLVNFCGVYGIGKSALLAELAERTEGYADVFGLSLQLPALPVGAKTTPLDARQAIIRQLHPHDGELPPDNAAADGALAACAAALLRRRQPILLLIEAEARHAALSFGWIERGLLLPLVRANRLVAVVTSHTPLRWRELDTRRRAESRILQPLNLAETALQLGGGSNAATAIYRLTMGLPLANAVAQHVLLEVAEPEGWDQSLQVALLQRSVDAIYARIGPELTRELRFALEALAVVREFAIPLLQRLFNSCDLPGQSRSQAAQLMMVRQLQELDLVVWDQTNNAWRVVPLLRSLLAQLLRLKHPAHYAALQRLACDYYRQMLDDVIVARHIHVAELFWHTIESQQHNGTTADEVLRDLVQRYLVSPDGQQVDSAALYALRDRLLQDAEQPQHVFGQMEDLTTLVALLDQTATERW